ncbi:MAG: dihydrolipoyl dehydrogenase [Candidatus Fermentibacteria bacterium]|nr:dihydrolipoyl dehydrogenase [Candidatus Fermentibacteria bacterium]
MREVDVVIIGAGTAGLSALGHVRRRTNNFVIINDGPYGTTCARIGCMPSKMLIEAADIYHKQKLFEPMGFKLNSSTEVDGKPVLKRVRELRDKLVKNVNRATKKLEDKNISGKAKILSPNLVEVNGEEIQTKSMIIATGSRPVMPEQWKKFGSRILTNENIFEMETLPKSLAVVGLGSIGLELAQALSRLGVQVTGFDALDTVGGISDPEVSQSAIDILREEFPFYLESKVILKEGMNNQILVQSGDKELLVEKVLVAVGRKPNISGLSLENLGVPLNELGIPAFNENTMQIADLPVFIAGDVNNRMPLMAEAADDGHIAGVNSIKDKIQSYCRRSFIGLVFTHPNIAFVGKRFSELDLENTVIGSTDYSKQTRAMTAMINKGLLRIYADKNTGKLIGAEMAVPNGEHLAHLISWAVQKELTVFETLELNYYHPVTEEGIAAALRRIARKVEKRESGPEIPLCHS